LQRSPNITDVLPPLAGLSSALKIEAVSFSNTCKTIQCHIPTDGQENLWHRIIWNVPGKGEVAGPSERGIEPSGSTKCREFLD